MSPAEDRADDRADDRLRDRPRRYGSLAGRGFFGLAVVYVALQLWPFAPYSVRSYEALPPSACPGEMVAVEIERDMADNRPISAVRTIKPDSYWRDVETDETTAVQEGRAVPFGGPYGEATVRSGVLRDVPTEAGRYELITDVRVRGRVLILPRHQDLRFETGEILRVLASTEGKCRA